MKIREKLTLQFCTLVGFILITFSFSIFFISKMYRYNAFKTRLLEKALNTANMLIEVQAIDLNLLKELRRNYLQSLPEEFVRVYDRKNTAVYKDDTIHYALSMQTLEDVRQTGTIDFKRGDRQFVAIRYKNDYVIVASARNLFGAQELQNLAFILFAGNLVGLLFIFLAGRFFAKQALRPVSRMIREVDNIGETSLSSRLDEGKKKDELAQLAITFNRLFTRVEDAFVRQKRFVSNASHELRTPLTAITGEIEVALMKQRSPEEYIKVLHSVLEETKALTKLSNDLLKLTQTLDINGLIVEKISAARLLQVVTEETTRRSSRREFSVELRTDPDKIFISGNIELLKIALMNIVDNAYKFSDNQPVTLLLQNDKLNLFFTIKDQGIGMSEEEIHYAFQPFYRSSNVAAIPGSGIGLSLSEKIIKLHGGRIEIMSGIDNGSEVTTVLPLD